MKNTIFILFLFFVCFSNAKQMVETSNLTEVFSLDDSLEVFNMAEQMPSFVGNEDALYAYVSKNIIYPLKAKENNIEGRVVVRFIIEKDGAVSNIEILRKLGFGCDEEVIRLIKSMPKWIPGKQNGKPVRVYFTMPISFIL